MSLFDNLARRAAPTGVAAAVAGAAVLLVACPDMESTSSTDRSGTASTSCAAERPELSSRVRDVHDRQRNIGVAAALLRRDGIVFCFELGHADLEHDVPVDSTTRFGIASVTKLFTAVAALKLHAEGRIDLDAPVQAYLPEFPRKGTSDITLRQLATHRSGLPHPRNRTPELFATHYETATDALAFFEDVELAAEPGSERIYSSSNYNLLAAVVERVAGVPFREFVRTEILEPLDLSDTGFDDIRHPLAGRAERYSYYHPWTYEESQELYRVPDWDYSWNTGGGNMYSTPRDLVRFGRALIEPGLLPPEQMEILMRESWFGRVDDGRKRIYVTGSNPGVQAALVVYPDDGAAAAVLANTWGIGSRSAEMVALAPRLVGMSDVE